MPLLFYGFEDWNPSYLSEYDGKRSSFVSRVAIEEKIEAERKLEGVYKECQVMFR